MRKTQKDTLSIYIYSLYTHRFYCVYMCIYTVKPLFIFRPSCHTFGPPFLRKTHIRSYLMCMSAVFN